MTDHLTNPPANVEHNSIESARAAALMRLSERAIGSNLTLPEGCGRSARWFAGRSLPRRGERDGENRGGCPPTGSRLPGATTSAAASNAQRILRMPRGRRHISNDVHGHVNPRAGGGVGR